MIPFSFHLFSSFLFFKACITHAVPHLCSLIKSHGLSLVSQPAVPWAASGIRAPNATAPPRNKVNFVGQRCPRPECSFSQITGKNVFLAQPVRTTFHSCANEASKVQPHFSLLVCSHTEGTSCVPNNAKEICCPLRWCCLLSELQISLLNDEETLASISIVKYTDYIQVLHKVMISSSGCTVFIVSYIYLTAGMTDIILGELLDF